MASLYYKDENNTYQPIGVKLLGGTGGGKTYLHKIKGGAYATSDNDIGGSFMLIITSSSDAKITEPSEGGTAVDGIVGFLKKVGAENNSDYYPISFYTNGYTSCNWVGIYYKDGAIYVAENSTANTRTYKVDLSSIKEQVIEM